MDDDRIYLLDLDLSTPLELAPLIRIKPGPVTEQDACYFYNRLSDGNGVRLVSWHFESESEIREPDEAVSGLIARLKAAPGSI